jgi:phosphoribosylaminoimidazolecarboxamide formyltransferase/IMP cyclohydrolase
MTSTKKAKSALVSVFYKDHLEPLIRQMHNDGITIYSTGGTQKFIEDLGIPVQRVEDLTGYPSILGGRVKTLHPKVFGGILARREESSDLDQLSEYEIPEMDIVVVNLYPFEETVASGASEADIIEKIDIGGVSLIRAAAKNFKDVAICSTPSDYGVLQNALAEGQGSTTIEQRRELAARAFAVTAKYDTAIQRYFNADGLHVVENKSRVLRYGENPHQKGYFHGDLDAMFDQLHGKELSYNNLLDVDAAVNLIAEFDDLTFAILKHNNACGVASRKKAVDAFKDALAGDPVSAFGGIIIGNAEIDKAAAEEINKIFCEVVIAPNYTDEALEILKSKKNRIILVQKPTTLASTTVRTALNGFLEQHKDHITDRQSDLKVVTKVSPNSAQIDDLLFASKICKQTKSNTIVLAKDGQLLASGTGQTSRVDALRQAIVKAKSFGFDLNGAVMASDAFFPFPDCVEIADQEGINAVIQPGGSIKDQDSIDYCDAHEMAMVFTGTRHFKH